MPYVITLTHQKGGVGKSTKTLNLHESFREQGLKCGIVDSDPQSSILKLLQVFDTQESRYKIKVFERNSFETFKDLINSEKIQDLDVVLIDTPPYLTNELPDILAVTDLALVPTKASPMDALAIDSTLELIREAQNKNSSLKSAIFMTMTIHGTKLTGQMRKVFESKGFPVLNTEIKNRVAYSKSLLTSNSVLTEDDKKAKQEIHNLSVELLDFIKN